jgi:hypothetical protein
MSNTYRGSPEPHLQRYSESWSPATGCVKEAEYRGMSEERARAYLNYFTVNGFQSQLTIAHGICTLVATDTLGEVTIDNWEIGVNQTSASSFFNPRNIAAVGADSLEILAYAEKNGGTLEAAKVKVNTDRTSLGLPAITYTNSAAMVRMRLRLLKGSDSFFYDQYLLRHTTNVSNRYRVNVSDINKGCIYTLAQLQSETMNANSWIYPLPGRLNYKLINATNALEAGPANTLKGWLKGASPESTAANNRVNIVTEYKLANCDTDEYGVAV